MGVRIPVHCADTARVLGLKKWVARREFRKADYAAAIKAFRARLLTFSPDGQVPNEGLVQAIAATLDVEGELEEHVLKTASMEVSDADVWWKICTAAGWVVLQQFVREEVTDGG
ncbi:MAG: hypothetical protein JWM02_1327 [Frankiales bacterium]|nr:hypothetical protein [Frankiales bacterium]